MDQTETLTIEVPSSLKAKLADMAQARHMKLADFGEEALKAYVAHEQEVMSMLQEGIDAADKGDMVAHKDVVKDYEERKKEYFRLYGER